MRSYLSVFAVGALLLLAGQAWGEYTPPLSSYIQNAPKELESKVGFRLPTLNRMGDMLLYLDNFTQAFVEYAAHQKAPVLDLGAAYGFVTLAALKAGATVVANDIEPKHLEILWQNAPMNCRARLTLHPGHFPEALNFLPESFSAILASRLLHFFDDQQLEVSAAAMFRWLKPGGKAFIVAETPYLYAWRRFIPIYEKRKKEKVAAPGLLSAPHHFAPERAENLPEMIHFLDPEVLAELFTRAGFVIERVGFLSRPEYPPSLRLDGRESVGLIAVKPDHKS